MTIISLTTDFGTSDPYVGIMKGVILAIAPDVTIVDLTHEISAQNLRQGAFVLRSACRYFPLGTLHVAIVDPYVGSERQILAVRTERATFLAPDNGLLSWVLQTEQVIGAVSVTQRRYWLPEVSHTFHGRDIFAPVAAHIANGARLSDLGPAIYDWVKLPFPRPFLDDKGSIRGEVLYVDRFGNLVTNVEIHPKEMVVTNLRGGELVTLTPDVRIYISEHEIKGVARTYAAVQPGRLLALIGSSGYLEIAVREGSAAALLGVQTGDEVEIVLFGPKGEEKKV